MPTMPTILYYLIIIHYHDQIWPVWYYHDSKMVKTRPGCGSCVVSCCICVSHVSPGLVRVLQALVSAALLHDKDDFILLDIPQLCRPWNILELSSTCRFSKINSKINRIEAKTRCQTVRSSSPGSFRTKNFAWRAAFRTAFSLRVGLNLRANLQGQGEDLLRGLRSRYH